MIPPSKSQSSRPHRGWSGRPYDRRAWWCGDSRGRHCLSIFEGAAVVEIRSDDVITLDKTWQKCVASTRTTRGIEQNFTDMLISDSELLADRSQPEREARRRTGWLTARMMQFQYAGRSSSHILDFIERDLYRSADRSAGILP